VEYVIINAAECEPYITSDLRTMLDRSDDVLAGIAAVRKFWASKMSSSASRPTSRKLSASLSAFKGRGYQHRGPAVHVPAGR
jgi:Na+-translocating ferredoxin:NAD+ oxidoreductase RnfC subunit